MPHRRAVRSSHVRPHGGVLKPRRVWIATTSPRHFLLVRKHLRTGELAYHYCHVPARRTATLMTLVRVACLRWPVEEGFEFGKDHFGLDHSQVRLYTALLRHIVLTLTALAVCAVTAAQAKTQAPAPILPTTPDQRLRYVVGAAPTLPGTSRLRLRPASKSLLRQEPGESFHLARCT
jgi:hypothetical protein